MRQNVLMSLLQKDFTTVHVAFRADIKAAEKAELLPFESRKNATPARPHTFTYKAALSEGLKAEDYVVVETENSGPMIALVIEVDEAPIIDPDATFDYKWIVQRIDRKPYDDRIAREAEFLKTMKAVEAESQRTELVRKFAEHLPEGTDARAKFDAAVTNLTGTPLLSTNEAPSGSDSR